QVRFAPHNQLFRTLLDGSGLVGSHEHGVNIILVRLQDLGVGAANIEANARELIELIRNARLRLTPSPLIVSLCPPSVDFISGDQAVLARELAARFKDALDAAPGIHYLSWEQVEQFYPVQCVYDEHADRLAGIPYTELYFCALGTALVRLTHALFMEPYKVVALDCDFTLWSGICGEDGPHGVVIDAPHKAIQQFMLDQRQAGMLLAMASKNNEQDVLETFEAHPEMPLELRDFASWRLNWESKAANLNSLADELALGPD